MADVVTKQSKHTIAPTWTRNAKGNLTLEFPAEFETALKDGDLIASSTGKTATSVYVRIPSLSVTREGASSPTEFTAQMNVGAKVASAKAFSL